MNKSASTMPFARAFALCACCLAAIVITTTHPPVWAESYLFNVTSEVYGQPQTIDYQLILPDDVPFIRGLFFDHPGGCNSWIGGFDDPGWQAMASVMDFGILTLDSSGLASPLQSGCDYGFCGDPFGMDWSEPRQLFEDALAAAADVSVQPHLVNAPVALIGFSRGGGNALIISAAAPERVISVASYRGVPHQFSAPEAMKSVPEIWMAGSVDQAVHPQDIERAFDDIRGQNAQLAFALEWGADHAIFETSKTIEMGVYWSAEVIRQRYPDDVIPSPVPGNPVELLDIPMEDGWLAETPSLLPTTASPFPEIYPYAEYSGDPLEVSWLPNEALANVYRAFNGIDPTRPNPARPGQFLGSPLEFTSPATLVQAHPPTYAVGDTITVSVDPHEFDDVNSIVEMEFYDGDTLLSVDSEGPEWGMAFMPTEPGIHALVAIATDDLGNQTSNFRSVVVQPLHGDYNNDGVVNAVDYAVWRDNLGAPAGTLPNDPNRGSIGAAQYATWRENYGATGATAAGLGEAAVPEAASVLIVLMGVAMLSLCAVR